jgi:hypothetical protein
MLDENPEEHMTSQAIAERLAVAAAPAAVSFFDPTRVCDVPQPAQRWLLHAIAPGAPICDRVRLTMHGEIRLGRWRAFTATEDLRPDTGFVWAARTAVAGLPVTGYDAFVDGEGHQHWRLLGIVPVQSASGLEVTRSVADRLAAEAALLPTSLLDAQWRPGPNRDVATYARRVGGRYARARVAIHVDPDGRLREVSMARWGTPPGAPFGQYPFRVRFTGAQRRQGIAIPTDLAAAWHLPEGAWFEFFRAHIDSANFSWR